MLAGPLFAMHSLLHVCSTPAYIRSVLQAFTTVLLVLLQAATTKPALAAGSSFVAGSADDDDSPRHARSSEDHTFPPCVYTFLVTFTDRAMASRKEYVYPLNILVGLIILPFFFLRQQCALKGLALPQAWNTCNVIPPGRSRRSDSRTAV